MTLGKDITHPKSIRIFENLEARFREVHKDKYDYSKSIYLGMHQKIEIWCNKHQEYFWQTPDKHIQKRGCPKCASESRANKLSTPLNDFIIKANTKHNDKYDYSKSIYINSKTKIEIWCNIHQEYFWQTPTDHLQGSGCHKCGNITKGISKRTSYEDFVIKANIKHNNKYQYLPDKYEKAISIIDIICPIHGVFQQKVNNHLNGMGCPHCASIVRSKKYHNARTILYYIKFLTDDKNYFKIGITKQGIKRRYNNLQEYPHIKGYEIIASKEFHTGKLAYTIEQEIISTFKDLLTEDNILFGNGNSEVFDKDIYPDIQHHFV